MRRSGPTTSIACAPRSLTGDRAAAEGPAARRPPPAAAVLYGANHPYAGPPAGDPKAIAKFTRDDLVAFRAALDPTGQCEDVHRLGPSAVRNPASARGALRTMDGTCRSEGRQEFHGARRRGRLRRRSCSSIGRARRKSSIVGGELLPIDPRADIVPFDTANDVLGGTFLSRLNMDLRETKGWSYGVNGDSSVVEHAVPYVCRRRRAGRPHRGVAGRAQSGHRASS